jgi:hypothetical protein
MTLHAPNQIPDSTTAHELIWIPTQKPRTLGHSNIELLSPTHHILTSMVTEAFTGHDSTSIDYPQIIHSQKYNAENPRSSLYNSLPE